LFYSDFEFYDPVCPPEDTSLHKFIAYYACDNSHTFMNPFFFKYIYLQHAPLQGNTTRFVFLHLVRYKVLNNIAVC
jgi:hypothetical protein